MFKKRKMEKTDESGIVPEQRALVQDEVSWPDGRVGRPRLPAEAVIQVIGRKPPTCKQQKQENKAKRRKSRDQKHRVRNTFSIY